MVTSLQASASVGLESERSVPEGAANSYQDSIKAQYQSGEAAGAENGIEAFDEQQHQHQQEQLRMLLQDEQVHYIFRLLGLDSHVLMSPIRLRVVNFYACWLLQCMMLL